MKALYNHQQTVTTMTPTGPLTLTINHRYEHSAPMSLRARAAAYLLQTGRTDLTARQQRALTKASRRLAAVR